MEAGTTAIPSRAATKFSRGRLFEAIGLTRGVKPASSHAAIRALPCIVKTPCGPPKTKKRFAGKVLEREGIVLTRLAPRETVFARQCNHIWLVLQQIGDHLLRIGERGPNESNIKLVARTRSMRLLE